MAKLKREITPRLRAILEGRADFEWLPPEEKLKAIEEELNSWDYKTNEPVFIGPPKALRKKRKS